MSAWSARPKPQISAFSPAKARFDAAYAKGIEGLRNLQLLCRCQDHTHALFTVAQRGVVKLHRFPIGKIFSHFRATV